MTDQWLEPELAKWEMRLNYIRKMQSHVPSTCPECESELTTDDSEIYCENCGLVVAASMEYVAGQKVILPYGIVLL